MSAFDYPRLMLTGTAVCSPATGNNDRFIPLSFFDPVTGACALPPRLFLPDKEIEKMCLDGGMEVKEVALEDKKYRYIDIAPNVLNDIQNFKDWAILPLGKYEGDKEYHKLYKLIELKITGGKLFGTVPAYFNYYGTMEFDFRNVKVGSVALNPTSSGEHIVTNEDTSNKYDDLKDLFQLELKINDGLTSKAKMVDCSTTASLATQIFWDKLTLTNSSGVAFSGKPCKASLRFSNASRVPGTQRSGGAHCASGTFFSAIQLKDVENGQDAALIKGLFEKYKIRNDALIGLQVAFNLFEVKEDLGFKVKFPSNFTNNVETKVVVTITPWYRGDLKSISMGRQLNAGINYLKKCRADKDARVKDFFLSPIVAHVDYERHYVMLDFINSIPEKCSLVDLTPPQYPVPGTSDDCYETMDVGMLICKLYESGEELGRIKLNSKSFSRSHYLNTSGKQVLYNELSKSIDYKDKLLNNRIALYLYDSKGEKNLIGNKEAEDYVMLESEYMIAFDQGSLYAGEYEDPAHGYRSFSGAKEHCHIHIYRRGFEYPDRIPLTIAKCEVRPWNLAFDFSTYGIDHYKNGDMVSFPTQRAFNGLYLFYANIDAPAVKSLINDVYTSKAKKAWHWYYLMTYFNSYVAVRILPYQKYATYLDLNEAEKREKVTFKVLKEEIFDRYDALYPAMSRIFPFEEKEMRSYQDHIYKLMSLDNWGNSSYMPASRDLSPQQIRLFLQWMHENDPSLKEGAFHQSGGPIETIRSTQNVDGIVPR